MTCVWNMNPNSIFSCKKLDLIDSGLGLSTLIWSKCGPQSAAQTQWIRPAVTLFFARVMSPWVFCDFFFSQLQWAQLQSVVCHRGLLRLRLRDAFTTLTLSISRWIKRLSEGCMHKSFSLFKPDFVGIVSLHQIKLLAEKEEVWLLVK